MARNPVGVPHVIAGSSDDGSSSVRKIRRVPLAEGESEGWLQRLIHRHPDLLPANLVDERVQEPLFPVAMEVGTNAGYIDNLMISANGYPVIVETKLWRNPEARRKVVTQLLDYAAQVRRWSYEDLQAALRNSDDGGETKDSLWSALRPPDYDSEADWIDLVSENLRLGRFCLLIVGDGIRDEARQLADALSSRPDFQFRLGLVELRLYELGDSEMLAIPSCIARTVEIERAVVRVQQIEGGQTEVSVETPSPGAERERGRGSVLNEQAFLDELSRSAPEGDEASRVASRLLELVGDTDLMLDWQTASVSIKYPDPGDSGIVFSLGTIYKNGIVGCWISCLEPQLRKAFSDTERADKILKSHAERGRMLGMDGKKDIGLPLKRIAGSEEGIVQWLEGTVQMIHEQSEEQEKNLPQ